MIKWLFRKAIGRMEREFDYDAHYLREIVDVSTPAFIRYLGLPMLTQMTGPEKPLWAGASLASVLDGDCGPCTQLVVDHAVKLGVAPEPLLACLRRDFENAGSAGLGFQFAEASISDHHNLGDLRDKIEALYGKEAVIAAAYAAAASRAFPVLKRALGHGATCQSVRVAGIEHMVRREEA